MTTIAYRGIRVARFVANGDLDQPTEVRPLGENKYHEIQVGQIRVTCQARVGSDVDTDWVQPFAQYVHLVGGEFIEGNKVPIGTPVQMGPGALRPLYGDAQIEESEATHWILVLRATQGDPRAGGVRLPEGRAFYIESVFVPEGGLPVADQPYLDGDEPGGTWEGEPHRSTSIYGPKPVVYRLAESLVIISVPVVDDGISDGGTPGESSEDTEDGGSPATEIQETDEAAVLDGGQP